MSVIGRIRTKLGMDGKVCLGGSWFVLGHCFHKINKDTVYKTYQILQVDF